MMTEEQFENYQNNLAERQMNTDENKILNEQMQNEMLMEEQNRSLISEQLDLGEELKRIDYLLRGYVIEVMPDGSSKWVPPTNKEMIILSEYGVHLIRNTIAWYINKNTLLSNYDEDTINRKMEDFAKTLNDTIFMEYEKVFQHPTFEECKKVLNARIEKKKELVKYTYEILGRKVDLKEEAEIKEMIVKEMEPILQRELEKIKEQIMKNKLKRYPMIIREVQDAVHSTYLRAWKGQERTTLRQHIHISENKGSGMVVQAPSHNPLNWFSRKR